MDKVRDSQLLICEKYGVRPVDAPGHLKVGIASNAKTGIQPLNGLRCNPIGDTTGWYIWAGEQWSDDPNFFVPLHADHLASWCPAVIPFLLLPPGWRFLIAEGHEDVWFDEPLLNQDRNQLW